MFLTGYYLNKTKSWEELRDKHRQYRIFGKISGIKKAI